MMGTRDAINDWLRDRRKKARVEGHAEGHAVGRAEGHAEMAAMVSEWNSRRLEAEAKGESFAEPPPGVEDDVE